MWYVDTMLDLGTMITVVVVVTGEVTSSSAESSDISVQILLVDTDIQRHTN